ncbi:hypothetical protein C8Q80DRAFT_1213348 [Daedaleopsis nitida]|nr:hypothetical protein C8Q80DRAFT_1213348 [Daedaleopsis nitida]
MEDYAETNGKAINPAVDFFAGTHPWNAVKVRFQNPHIASKYRSTVHAFFKIVREERIRGLYQLIKVHQQSLVRTSRAFPDSHQHDLGHQERSSV